MAVQTFYGFIQEEAFTLSSRMDLSTSTETDLGKLIGEPYNYLVAKSSLNDSREERLGVLDTKVPNGKISFLFDSNRFDPSLLNDENLTDEEQNHIFNIAERIIFRDKEMDIETETVLISDESLYSGYVAKSLRYSDDTSTGTVVDTAKTSVIQEFRDWIEFKFESEKHTITFHLWLSRKSFADGYPYVTITAVIPPADLEVLCDPNTLANYSGVNLMRSASTFIFDKANIETTARDQNGIFTFVTKYVLSSTKSVQIPFALPYCGAHEPDSLDCRKAIREYLEKNAPVTNQVLEQILPDIYITCRFYMVPLWDVYTQRTERDVYNSIWKVATLTEKVNKLFPEMDSDYLQKYMELMTNAQFKAISVVIPDTNNGDEKSVLDQHPTYQDYSSQVPGWKYMTAETQEFAGKLNRVMTILNGDLVSEEFLTANVGQATYLVFSSGKAEYLVMYRSSYEAIMKNR